MSDTGQPKKRFPLTLDFVTGIAGRKQAAAPHRLNSPQTATQNVAKAAGQTAARNASAARGATPRSSSYSSHQPVLVEISEDGVKVFQGDTEIEAIVVDLREFMEAPASERVKRTSELLLRTLELPRPLADRVVRRIADLP